MNKQRLVQSIIDRLHENLGVLDKAARASHAEATHESSKAENKYDTRGLEAAYLAGGQARQARETIDAIQAFEKLTLKDFKKGNLIDLSAIVEVEAEATTSTYFIGPKSGGLEVMVQKKEVMVITPQSPLGTQLLGKKPGDKWSTKLGGREISYKIIRVQ